MFCTHYYTLTHFHVESNVGFISAVQVDCVRISDSWKGEGNFTPALGPTSGHQVLDEGHNVSHCCEGYLDVDLIDNIKVPGTSFSCGQHFFSQH